MKSTFNILLFLLAGTLVSDNCDAFRHRFDLAKRAVAGNTQNMREIGQNQQADDALLNEQYVQMAKCVLEEKEEETEVLEKKEVKEEKEEETEVLEKKEVKEEKKTTLPLLGNKDLQSIELTSQQVDKLLNTFRKNKKKNDRIKNLNGSANDLNAIINEDVFPEFGKLNNGSYQISGDALEKALSQFADAK